MVKRNIIIKYIGHNKPVLNEKNDIIYSKTLEYINIFSKLEKEKVHILRKIINNNINKFSKKSKRKLQIQFAICKIIDLMPISFEEIVLLIPNFITIFGYKDGKSLINTIFYIIKN